MWYLPVDAEELTHSEVHQFASFRESNLPGQTIFEKKACLK